MGQVQSPAATRYLTVRPSGDITTLKFLCPDLLNNDAAVERMGEELFHLVGEGRRRLVLSLAGVARFNSSLLGKLIALHKKVRTAGGKLVLCAPPPELRRVLESTQLTRIFTIYPTEAEAVQALQ